MHLMGKVNNPVLLNEEAVKKLGFANPQESIKSDVLLQIWEYRKCKE